MLAEDQCFGFKSRSTLIQIRMQGAKTVRNNGDPTSERAVSASL